MKERVSIGADALAIDREAVFRGQGMTEKTKITKTVEALFEKSLAIFRQQAVCDAIIADASIEEFMDIYRGEGRNDVPSVVELIVPKARSLTLFALTSGRALTDEIKRLFDEKDVALGYMVDLVASEGTEAAAEELTRRRVDVLRSRGEFIDGDAVLRYSPGYCGWHVSGQKKLLSFLGASEIGISLNESFLMSPEKSISGVMIAGEKKIHFFKNNFSFCEACTHKSCRTRIRSLGGIQ
jgi:hypothetical protein